MHPIFYYIIGYLLLGALGMHLGNKKQDQRIQRQRWSKYFSYVIITGLVIGSIFLNLFRVAAIIIISVGLFEIINANFSGQVSKTSYRIISILFYLVIIFGFWKFSLSFGKSFLLLIYFQVLIFDAFCQVTGQIIGKHKLAPKISPSKTIEGLIGGWVFCIASAILGASWIHVTILTAILLGIVTGLTSFAGDLLGSYFKRALKIKDFSNILPGQGGFLDRFGSLMVTGGFYFLLDCFGMCSSFQ